MHFEIDINISGSLLAGVVSGAIAAALVIAIFAIPATLIDNLMSFGGGLGFPEMFLKGAKWYVPIGAVVGGLVASLGFAWWVAAVVVILGMFLLSVVWQIVERRKQAH